MGKKDKEHRKRVTQRNAELKGIQNAYQKIYKEVMTKQLEALREEREQRQTQESDKVDDIDTSTGITLNIQQ